MRKPLLAAVAMFAILTLTFLLGTRAPDLQAQSEEDRLAVLEATLSELQETIKTLQSDRGHSVG